MNDLNNSNLPEDQIEDFPVEVELEDLIPNLLEELRRPVYAIEAITLALCEANELSNEILSDNFDRIHRLTKQLHILLNKADVYLQKRKDAK